MKSNLTRQQAYDLLRKYNQESFHIQHALTVEAVMRWFARDLGYGDDEVCSMISISSFIRSSTA